MTSTSKPGGGRSRPRFAGRSCLARTASKLIIAFLDFAKTKKRGDWLLQPDLLQTELKRHNIDIWFSTERSALTPNNAIIFLDGDLLSAMGTIVVHQADLLPPSVPAGLPFRGVDFGLDAFAVRRDGNVKKLLFSTEIGYRPEKTEGPAPSFTDGDVLSLGDGVVKKNWDLIKHFNPATNDLGLDALFLGETPPPRIPNIQSMCGGLPVVDFDGGVVPVGGLGTGLYQTNLSVAPPGTPPRRPCGEYVPIDGYLPAGITKFRVAYRLAGTPVPPVGTAPGVRTNWTLFRWDGALPGCVVGPTTLTTDADGWMDADAYLKAKSGLLTGCANSGLRLAVWDTNNHVGFGPPDREGQYVLWLEWEDGAGLHHERLGAADIEHHLQLDNTLPAIAAYPQRAADPSARRHHARARLWRSAPGHQHVPGVGPVRRQVLLELQLGGARRQSAGDRGLRSPQLLRRDRRAPRPQEHRRHRHQAGPHDGTCARHPHDGPRPVLHAVLLHHRAVRARRRRPPRLLGKWSGRGDRYVRRLLQLRLHHLRCRAVGR